MPSQKSGKGHLVRLKVSRRAVLSFTILILLIGIVFLLMDRFSQRNFFERVDFTPNYDIILTEAKTFWGGVWFNQDRLFILRNEFMIEKNPFIGERKTYHISYEKVKNVPFEQGLGIDTSPVWSVFFARIQIRKKRRHFVLTKKVKSLNILKHAGNARWTCLVTSNMFLRTGGMWADLYTRENSFQDMSRNACKRIMKDDI